MTEMSDSRKAFEANRRGNWILGALGVIAVIAAAAYTGTDISQEEYYKALIVFTIGSLVALKGLVFASTAQQL